MENGELSILDDCKLEGGAIVMERYAHYLKGHLKQIVENYESTDFNRDSFLAEVDYALDNANTIIEIANMTKEIVTAMRAEISPIFKDNKENVK